MGSIETIRKLKKLEDKGIIKIRQIIVVQKDRMIIATKKVKEK